MRRALLSAPRIRHVNQEPFRPRWASTKQHRPRGPQPPPPPKQRPTSRNQSPSITPHSATSPSRLAAEPPSGSLVKPVSEERVRRYQAPAWVAASLLAGGLAYYCVSLYIAATQPCRNPDACKLEHQKDVASVYDTTADGFDSEVAFSEWIGGVDKIRKQLAKRCKGDVLEVSCGTGRNLGYYDLNAQGVNAVRSLTFIDLSPQMIDVCKRKWAVLFDSKKRAQRSDLSVRFLTGSALDPIHLAPNVASNGKETGERKKYTTIFQTMGLCSTPSPAPLIENIASHLDLSDPDARIFLLEHGRSYTQWLNRILDNSAEKHADIHGCWFNRDIGGLVSEAATKAGLEVVWERRHNLGTVWVFELKPTASKPHASQEQKDVQTAQGDAAKSSGWWNVIRVK